MRADYFVRHKSDRYILRRSFSGIRQQVSSILSLFLFRQMSPDWSHFWEYRAKCLSSVIVVRQSFAGVTINFVIELWVLPELYVKRGTFNKLGGIHLVRLRRGPYAGTFTVAWNAGVVCCHMLLTVAWGHQFWAYVTTLLSRWSSWISTFLVEAV